MTKKLYIHKTTGKQIPMESLPEVRCAEQLDDMGIRWEYEPIQIEYLQPAKKIYTADLELITDVYTKHIYTPDFYCPDYNSYIEVKGWFKAIHRKKHIGVRDTWPDMVVNILFQYNGWIGKKKVTSYTQWCMQQHIPCSVTNIPKEWFQ